MRMTMEYLAFLLKERYLEKLIEAWDIEDQKRSNKKLFEVLPPIAKSFLEESDLYPKIIIFNLFDGESIRFDFLVNETINCISLYRSEVVLVKTTKHDNLLHKELKYSDLITSNESYDILSTPENEVFEISSAELIAFGLELKE